MAEHCQAPREYLCRAAQGGVLVTEKRADLVAASELQPACGPGVYCCGRTQLCLHSQHGHRPLHAGDHRASHPPLQETGSPGTNNNNVILTVR